MINTVTNSGKKEFISAYSFTAQSIIKGSQAGTWTEAEDLEEHFLLVFSPVAYLVCFHVAPVTAYLSVGGTTHCRLDPPTSVTVKKMNHRLVRRSV